MISTSGPAPPKPDRRRVLDLLASCADGCTEAFMIAHGLTVQMLVELVRRACDRDSRALGCRRQDDRANADHSGRS
jgi:hypothetical protein